MNVNQAVNDFETNERTWHREVVRISAQYFVKDHITTYHACTIIDLSRGGAGVVFPVGVALQNDDAVFLDITVPHTYVQLTIIGKIKRLFKDGQGLVGGIQFDSPLPDKIYTKLMGAVERIAPSPQAAQLAL